MNNNSNNNNGKNVHIPKKEKTLLEILQIILKHKFILILSVCLFLIAALVYSFTALPKYEATVTLKKENNAEDKQYGAPDISTMLNLQSSDIIETEIQLVTTDIVISKVVDELDLYCTIKGLKWGKSKLYDINKIYVDMLDPAYRAANSQNFIIPNKFEVVYTDTSHLSGVNFIIRKDSEREYTILDGQNKKIISQSDNRIDSTDILDTLNNIHGNINLSKIRADHFYILINWDEAPVNSELIISFNNYDKTIEWVRKGAKVSREGQTDIFYLTYSSSSATSSAIIANSIVENFRETRLSQKKEAIRYSYNFVDQQLNEVQDKLKKSEEELSNFKASRQIMSIDASSQELTGFLSNLEAEKYNTELQLTDLKNKASDLQKELRQSGYFDQSNLGPQGVADNNSPFSLLMSHLANLELQRLDLLQKRTENHPDVIALDEQIKLVKSKLAGFNENTITAYNIMINTAEKKLLKISDLMSKYEVKLENLPSQENQLAQLMRQQSTYERIFTILLDQREAMRVAELSKMQDITIVDMAKVPDDPSWPKKRIIILVGLVFGGFFGLILVFGVELYKTRFVNLDELETEFQVPILSIIPRYSKEITKSLKNDKSEYKIATVISEDTGLVETYRLFRTKLFQKLNNDQKILMITSCEEGTGKTSVAANFAFSLSQEGKKILLIDCDLRKGELSRMFGLSKEQNGLIEYLKNDTKLRFYSRASKLLDIIPSGGIADDSGTILNSSKMQSLLSHLPEFNYDLVIIDSPPVTRVVDPLVLAQFIKDVIVIVRPSHSLIETVRWGMQELKQADVKIVGIVANAATIENSYYYRYRYGYGYGYHEKNSRNYKLSN